MSNEEKLSGKERLEIAVKAGLQLVPYIGGSLASLYFDAKQEKRFKRLESFYEEFSQFVNESGVHFPPIEIHNKDDLFSIIEELNEKIEKENSLIKRNCFKKFLFNTLAHPGQLEFDEQRFFLDALASMTLLECEILAFLHHQPDRVIVGSINKKGVDQYAIIGSIGRLKSYGFINTFIGSITLGGGVDDTLSQSTAPTAFGQKFISFCLS